MFMQCSLCIACCVLHTNKHSLYMTLIELCFSCGFGACRHCCYLIMCCPHRHDCCYISVIYCVLPVGAYGHCHRFIFVLLLYVCRYCHICGYWRRYILYAVGTAATAYFMLCTAGTAKKNAWVLPPLYILYVMH